MLKKNKKIIGLTERVIVIGGKNKEILARIDTGASLSAIDRCVAKDLKLGPVIKTKMIKSTHGKTRRPVVKAQVMLAGKKITAEFTIANRKHMKYNMLIGQNILCSNGFLIDPTKK